MSSSQATTVQMYASLDQSFLLTDGQSEWVEEQRRAHARRTMEMGRRHSSFLRRSLDRMHSRGRFSRRWPSALGGLGTGPPPSLLG